MRVHPKGLVLALAVVLPLTLSLGLVLRGELTEPAVPLSDVGPAPNGSGPARTLELRFVRADDERLQVQEARTGRILRTVSAADGGFMFGILRPLERERERHGAPLEAPYHLVRSGSGRLVLEDPESDLEVELAAFGATSEGLFRSLIDGGPSPAVPPLFPSPPSMEDRP